MPRSSELPRVFITGCGVFVPGGNNLKSFWNTLVSGESLVGRISAFDPSGYPTQIAAEIKNFEPKAYFPPKVSRRTERYTQFALIASNQAMQDAKLDSQNTEGELLGIYEGSSLGPTGWFLDQHSIFLEKGYRRANPLALAIGFPGAASARVAYSLGASGPIVAVTGGSVAATLALCSAFAALRSGEVDNALVVGSEAPIHPAILASFCTVNAMSRRNEDPRGACRPFDTDRDGFVLGEGAAAIVLETEESLLRRDREPYAELKSTGTSCDNHHITAPDPSGRGIAKAMKLAILKAGLKPDLIDHFNAHGTATRLNDEVEASALREVFGSYSSALPVTSIKGTIGHCLGACGLIEIVASLLMLQNQIVLPTANVSKLDKACPLNVISDMAISTRLENVMSNNYSFGGKNTSVILSRPNALRNSNQ